MTILYAELSEPRILTGDYDRVEREAVNELAAHGTWRVLIEGRHAIGDERHPSEVEVDANGIGTMTHGEDVRTINGRGTFVPVPGKVGFMPALYGLLKYDK